MIRVSLGLPLIAFLSLGLASCSWFGVRSDYEQARETRPLEIPPELDSPSQTGTMRVPEVPGAPEPQLAGGTAAPITAGPARALAVADSVSGVYRRVGLALERSSVAQIVARDEAGAAYTVSGTTTVKKPTEGGFFKKLFSSDASSESMQVNRIVRVVAEGNGSVVQIEDEQGRPADDELARRLIEAIRQRLG